MIITYYGLSCFKLEVNNLVIGLNPFAKNEKLGITRAPRFKAQVVLVAQPENELYNYLGSIEGQPLIFDSPGEYEVAGVFIQGFSSPVKLNKSELRPNTIFLIKTEELTLASLAGFKGEALSEGILERLGEVDVLLVPVGGQEVAEAEQAVSLINQIEPKIVIPMHYQLKGLNLKLATLEDFIQEINLKPTVLEKFSAKKLPTTEELSLINLIPQNFS